MKSSSKIQSCIRSPTTTPNSYRALWAGTSCLLRSGRVEFSIHEHEALIRDPPQGRDVHNVHNSSLMTSRHFLKILIRICRNTE